MVHSCKNDDDLDTDILLQCQYCFHNIGGKCSSRGSPYYGKHPKGDVIRPCYRYCDDMMVIDTSQTKLC